MPADTLVSLAMLKVKIDQGGDYLDYLRPFILQVLVDNKPERITGEVVRGYILSQFGLDIPERAVRLVIKRLAREFPIKKEMGTYHIAGRLPDPGISERKTTAENHINAVVNDFIEFSTGTGKPIEAREDAVSAICTFLSEFNIPCLRAYLRGTALPNSIKRKNTDIVLVSRYVLHLEHTNPNRLDDFMVLMQGHMLANALLCPDLQNAPKTYRKVIFFLDTPLLIQRLGLEGELKETAITGLTELLRKLGAKVAFFSHSREELERVVRGAADYIESVEGRGSIIREARRAGTTKSDLLLLAGKIDTLLSQANIEIRQTPPFLEEFQIDESTFESVLKDEVYYNNPRAIEDDINSVRSIYALRAGTSPTNVEKSKAVLVSSNAAFARAAFEYGKDHEEFREVSSVITDYSLANMAWLKAPMGARTIPTTEMLSFAYAAFQPTRKFWAKALTEAEKLIKLGAITPRDHQILRSSSLAQDELMRLTLGDEAALTQETVTETIRRVSDEIKHEEMAKVESEKEEHKRTKQELETYVKKEKLILEGIHWKCERKANRCILALLGVTVALLLAGLGFGFGYRSNNPVVALSLAVGSGLLLLFGAANTIFGVTVRDLYRQSKRGLYVSFYKRDVEALNISIEDVRV